MALSRPITPRHGEGEIPADQKYFVLRWHLGAGEDLVVPHLSGASWPSGLVLTPVGSADGVRYDEIPDAATITALGLGRPVAVQGYSDFGLMVTTVGAAGFVAATLRGHQDVAREDGTR